MLWHSLVTAFCVITCEPLIKYLQIFAAALLLSSLLKSAVSDGPEQRDLYFRVKRSDNSFSFASFSSTKKMHATSSRDKTKANCKAKTKAKTTSCFTGGNSVGGGKQKRGKEGWGEVGRCNQRRSRPPCPSPPSSGRSPGWSRCRGGESTQPSLLGNMIDIEIEMSRQQYPNKQATPLTRAVEARRPAIVGLLLKYGATSEPGLVARYEWVISNYCINMLR